MAQPMVPLRSASTLSTPSRARVRAPMMERVRPAQCTTTGTPGATFSAPKRSASSPPGSEREPGSVAEACSSGVRESSSTNSLPASIHARSSSGPISATACSVSTRSPKSFEGTLTPHSVGSPSVTHRNNPPSSTAISV
jgi:hypothetical protein